ncbi:hypothetical protein F0562_035368 [Nyssa sinensis]|uniref:Serine/threonine-protein phosphatase n=1 Tax=Nyssa sinensis TaxID=561372 RepID=A0A5J5A9X3_9ASTE|nr:hypothetical protein F0562_035368 [Nyssa sinensis]
MFTSRDVVFHEEIFPFIRGRNKRVREQGERTRGNLMFDKVEGEQELCGEEEVREIRRKDGQEGLVENEETVSDNTGEEEQRMRDNNEDNTDVVQNNKERQMQQKEEPQRRQKEIEELGRGKRERRTPTHLEDYVCHTVTTAVVGPNTAQTLQKGSPKTVSFPSPQEMERSALDNVIKRLLEVRGRPGKQVQLSESEIRQLCLQSKDIFLQQPMLLELEAPVQICGDIKGQYSDLLRIFEYGGYPPESNYLFLGDYVDEGKQGLETICLLLAYKIKYPENFFLLRGNHECASVNRIYGFYDECKQRFNVRLWKGFIDCFNSLPVAAIVDDKILCMHGGLSPDLHDLDQIRNIPRPVDVPDTGLLCDLLWSDPSRDLQGWGMNDRGVSYTFGPDKVTEFLLKHDLDLICRGHQVVEDGYEFFADKQLVTIFSAPNYRGEFDNAAAIMCVDESLLVSFRILKPVEKKSKFSFGNRTSANQGTLTESMEQEAGPSHNIPTQTEIPVVQTTYEITVTVTVPVPVPSAPPVENVVIEDIPIHYPLIDSSPVDLSCLNLEDLPADERKEDGGASSCVICLDAPIEGACVPCGHMPGCMSCLNEIKAKNWGCPVCRKEINQVVRLYAV